jgi:hypothetical protein
MSRKLKESRGVSVIRPPPIRKLEVRAFLMRHDGRHLAVPRASFEVDEDYAMRNPLDIGTRLGQTGYSKMKSDLFEVSSLRRDPIGSNGTGLRSLITAREPQRSVIPKGSPLEDRQPHRTAEIEAFQEAGAKGSVSRKAIGAYPYAKLLRDGEARQCLV